MNEITNPGFSSKDPAERIPIAFNFQRDLDALGDVGLAASPVPVVTITRHSGEADATPSTMIDGAPWISGPRVKQWVISGVVGCNYSWRCEAYSDSGAKLALVGTMLVRAK